MKGYGSIFLTICAVFIIIVIIIIIGYVKIQEFMNRDTTNVEPEMSVYTVITGATGIVTRSLRKNLKAMPRKHSRDSLQKTGILGTSHIIRKVLQCET